MFFVMSRRHSAKTYREWLSDHRALYWKVSKQQISFAASTRLGGNRQVYIVVEISGNNALLFKLAWSDFIIEELARLAC